MFFAPKSYLKLNLAKSNTIWTYAIIAGLCLTNIATGTALYFAPEIQAASDVKSNIILSAYEQRLLDLRLEVDRLHSRQYSQVGDMNLQMHELVQQQEILTEQHQYVRALAEMADSLGIVTTPITSNLPQTLPQANVEDLVINLVHMQDETMLALTSIAESSSQSSHEIHSELAQIGIFSAPAINASASGGPFIAVGDSSNLDLLSEVNSTADALNNFKSAQNALDAAPIRAPSTYSLTSSSYGTREDPFLKRAAHHSGIDFPMPIGTSIFASASGEVVFAGKSGGYGNMIDIDHGNGFITRYGHLNVIGVHKGQQITSGTRIASSGNTGRSTGPHLHFEVRKNDRALNPIPYLNAGKKLAAYIK